jgi:hypothetical protein
MSLTCGGGRMTYNHYQWPERADGAAFRWTRRRRAEPEDGSYDPAILRGSNLCNERG